MPGPTESEILVGSRIKEVRQTKRLTQKEFAASLGIVQGFLSAIERGRKLPSHTLLIALCHYYRINKEWLLAGEGQMFVPLSSADIKQASARNMIPVLNGINEGFPEKLTNVETYISLPDTPEKCYALFTYGDFMAPTIRDGDLVIFTLERKVGNGDVVLVHNRWGEPILRRFRIKNNEVFLTPDNLSYAAFKPDPDTKTIGAVVEVWRKVKI